jgi:histidinol-phosphate aminotransferase/imidazoleglycerol-phosphate dehydratase/histidinol-phosphatase
MRDWLKNLIRPDLREVAGYSSAKMEAAGFVPDIALDANEFPWPPFGPLAAGCKANRYPEPQPAMLVGKLASVWGVKPEQLFVGRGSDDAIDVLLRLFCEAGKDQILICPPTFGAYKVYATIQGAATISVPLRRDDWQLDVPAILKACAPQTKLIFIPTPNAPMGHLMKRDDVLALCKGREGQSLIVADEAYVEFTDTPQGLAEDLAAHPNLVLLRTLSKSHALAGERIGAAIADPEIIAQLQKVRAPYPLTQSSIRVALDALGPNGLIQSAEYRRVLVAERTRLTKLLPQSAWITGVFPSVTNFILVQTKDSKAFMQHLQSFGILVRNRNGDLPNTVRITLGSPADNDVLLKALGVTLPEPAKSPRLFSARRGTKETAIDVTVNLDAPNFLKIDTGIGFFDHMLAQVASHGGFGLELHCKGDLEIDQHHTIEDCALTLGEALRGALGDKRGLARFGFSAPLDEALANVVVDLSGRPCAVFEGTLPAPTIGEMSAEMVPHFYRSLATALGAAIHVTVKGDNAHHMTEASFKALGRALRQAFRYEGQGIPSTKGVL